MDRIIGNIIDFVLRLRWFLRENFLHFEIGWENGPYFHVLTHNQLLDNKMSEYKKLSRELGRKEFIKQVLEDSEGIQFIVFLHPEMNNYFVQFNRSKGNLYLDFPVTVYNSSNLGRQKEVAKILEGEGFKKKLSINAKEYGMIKFKSGNTLCANFQKDYELAARLADTFFSELFKVDDRVEARVL